MAEKLTVGDGLLLQAVREREGTMNCEHKVAQTTLDGVLFPPTPHEYSITLDKRAGVREWLEVDLPPMEFTLQDYWEEVMEWERGAIRYEEAKHGFDPELVEIEFIIK